jgi:uncharacterized UPF0160 family protein
MFHVRLEFESEVFRVRHMQYDVGRQRESAVHKWDHNQRHYNEVLDGSEVLVSDGILLILLHTYTTSLPPHQTSTTLRGSSTFVKYRLPRPANLFPL